MRRLVLAIATAALAGLFAEAAAAQCSVCPPPPPPPPLPPPADSPVFVDNGVRSGLLDLGSHFLWRQLGSNATTSPGSNNEGSGASPNDQVKQRFRTWAEGYGQWSNTNDHDGISGDRRRTGGAVAGFGFVLAPGAAIGFAVDQGWSRIDVNTVPQNARFKLTQLGVNSTLEFGQFSLGIAGIYGFADVDTSRGTATPGTLAIASYGAKLWGTLVELGYLIPLGNNRIVPKVAFDWVRTQVDGFSEIGGLDPATVASQVSQRTRAYAGAEVGHSWVDNRTLYDISAYGRLVDILSESGLAVQVTSPSAPGVVRTVQGTTEGHFGFDGGASASMRLNPSLRLYTNYDVRARSHYLAHIGTLGLEVKW